MVLVLLTLVPCRVPDNDPSGALLEAEVDAADGTLLDVETAEDFAQEFEDDGTEEDGDAA